MTAPGEKIVLDSFALLSFLKDEPGSDLVEKKMRSAVAGRCRLMMSLINLGEVIYILYREMGEEFAVRQEAEIFRLPIEFIESDWSLIREAAVIKDRYPIAFADCFAAATALRQGAAIVTGDPEFRNLKERVNIIWLAKQAGP